MSHELNRVLDALHRASNERMESALLGYLLKDRKFRRILLDQIHLPKWEEGDSAEVTWEYRMVKGSADILVEWMAGTKKTQIIIENKPWCGFTENQPMNYIRFLLKESDASRAVFVLLHNQKDLPAEAAVRLRGKRTLWNSTSGEPWYVLEQRLTQSVRGRRMRHLELRTLYEAFVRVDGNVEQQTFSQFLLRRHPVGVEMPEEWIRPLEDCLKELSKSRTKVGEDEIEHYEDCAGLTLWQNDGINGYLWLGIVPETSKLMGRAPDALVLIRAGTLGAERRERTTRWAEGHGLEWSAVQAGDWTDEEAVFLEPDTAPSFVSELLEQMEGRAQKPVKKVQK